MNDREYCRFSPCVSRFEYRFDLDERKYVCACRYLYAKEAGSTSFGNILKNAYRDHDWEYSDEGSVNMHADEFNGNDGAELEEKGVQGAIVEATELLLHV